MSMPSLTWCAIPGTRSRALLSRVGVLSLLAALSGCRDSPSAPRLGALSLAISGVPAGGQAAVTVTGPAGTGFSRAVTVSETLRNLTPGLYTVTANDVVAASGIYAAVATSQQVQVAASATPTVASVVYGIATGAISLDISGLPVGEPAAVTLAGPNGFSRHVTEPGIMSNLVPGSYTLSAASVQVPSGHSYSGSPLSLALTVLASETPRAVSVTYALATGALDVSVSGLPQGASANVSVTGPSGFNRALTGSAALTGLFPGTYTVTATAVDVSGTSYSPTPSLSSVDVLASLTPRQASVTYTIAGGPPPPGFNLTIDGMYLTQAVQTYRGDVPLVADRPGFLRVFVRATTANSAQPSVRVRLYQGTTLAQTLVLASPSTSVPTEISEGTLASSWNADIPASLIQPGLRILADVDPTNAILEADEGDNLYPVDGSPSTPSLQNTLPLNLALIPVQHTSNGATGNVTQVNLDQYLVMMRKVLPIRDIVPTLHAVFATSTPPVESNDGNASWIQLLGEIDALRVAEGGTGYYMGIVNVSYSSGIAGYGYAPGRATVAWDRLPNASPIAAHELSHNLGRFHAPCGGVSGADPNYPYPFGIIGVYGYDISLGLLKPPSTSDLMGYCGFGWISDYNYVGILNYRASTTNSTVTPGMVAPSTRVRSASSTRETSVQSTGVRSSLVVWGRIEDGQPVLEPAFAAVTRPLLPSRAGPQRIEGLASDGRVLFSYSFEGDQPADLAGRSVRQFTFAIPLDAATAGSIAILRLISETGATTELVASPAPLDGLNALEATRSRPGEVAFRVRDPAVRLAVVRDRATGQIVAFVRGGTTVLRSRATDFDVELSDGVRSVRRPVRAVPR